MIVTLFMKRQKSVVLSNMIIFIHEKVKDNFNVVTLLLWLFTIIYVFFTHVINLCVVYETNRHLTYGCYVKRNDFVVFWALWLPLHLCLVTESDAARWDANIWWLTEHVEPIIFDWSKNFWMSSFAKTCMVTASLVATQLYNNNKTLIDQ